MDHYTPHYDKDCFAPGRTRQPTSQPSSSPSEIGGLEKSGVPSAEPSSSPSQSQAPSNGPTETIQLITPLPSSSPSVSSQPTSCALENLSFEKNAVQSSTEFGGVASRAVDGNTLGVFANASITHTALGDNPWWYVDLDGAFRIEEVVIWNRLDCCSDRLSGAVVRLLTSLSDDGSDFASQITLPDMTGQPQFVWDTSGVVNTNIVGVYIFIPDSDAYLSLAEVEVLGTNPNCPVAPSSNPSASPTSTPSASPSKSASPSSEPTPQCPPVNVALGQPTFQNTTAFGGDSSRAVDGNTNPLYSSGSITHTTQTQNPWWFVDLGSPQVIEEVVIWNRLETPDCCSGRLSGATVRLLTSISNPGSIYASQVTLPDMTGQEKFVWDTSGVSNTGIVGVYVVLPGTEFLSLAEVQVFVADSTCREPSSAPSEFELLDPASLQPSLTPTVSSQPSQSPSKTPSTSPSGLPTLSQAPSTLPSQLPSSEPSSSPSVSQMPSASPSQIPSSEPSSSPSVSQKPSAFPSQSPSSDPSSSPSVSQKPSAFPSQSPSSEPSSEPSVSQKPSAFPSLLPSTVPSSIPTETIQLITPLPSSSPSVSSQPTSCVVENIALGKNAVQSSTDYGGEASRAVDGNTNPNYSAGKSITHTAMGDNPWWYVDLDGEFRIEQVVIRNRLDCCSERLSGAVVRLLTSLSDDGSDFASQITLPDMTGQPQFVWDTSGVVNTNIVGVYIFIPDSDAYLSLAEVEVLGTNPNCPVAPSSNPSASPTSTPSASPSKSASPSSEPTPQCPPVNVALGQPTFQNTTAFGGDSSRAVDGNTNPLYSSGSITHTTQTQNPWWFVDLGSPQVIEEVVIWNRLETPDCCSGRLSGATVRLLTSISNPGSIYASQVTLPDMTGQEKFVWDTSGVSNTGIVGVYVVLPGTEFLSLAEVQVFVADSTCSEPSSAPSEFEFIEDTSPSSDPSSQPS